MDDMAHRMQLEHMKTTFSEQLGAMSEELKAITLRAERAEAELHAVQAARPQDGDGDGDGSGVTLASMQAKYDALLQARASDAEEAARALAAERDEREQDRAHAQQVSVDAVREAAIATGSAELAEANAAATAEAASQAARFAAEKEALISELAEVRSESAAAIEAARLETRQQIEESSGAAVEAAVLRSKLDTSSAKSDADATLASVQAKYEALLQARTADAEEAALAAEFDDDEEGPVMPPPAAGEEDAAMAAASSGSALSSGDAWRRLWPCWATAASTISLSPRSAGAAYSSASPCWVTAAAAEILALVAPARKTFLLIHLPELRSAAVGLRPIRVRENEPSSSECADRYCQDANLRGCSRFRPRAGRGDYVWQNTQLRSAPARRRSDTGRNNPNYECVYHPR